MTKDLAFADTEQEIAATRRFLERVPKDQLDWRPHEKSMTLGRLSMHCAEIPGAAARIFETDEYHYNPPGDPPAPRREESTTGDAVALLDTNAAKLRELLRSVDDASLARPWTFKAFGHTIYTVPKLHAYRIRVLNHLIHHRAQLGVYLRLLGVSLPATPYGPSADERPAFAR